MDYVKLQNFGTKGSLKSVRFRQCKTQECLYFVMKGSDKVTFLCHVDDTGHFGEYSLIQWTKKKLSQFFRLLTQKRYNFS